jgi:hypothetical protein
MLTPLAPTLFYFQVIDFMLSSQPGLNFPPKEASVKILTVALFLLTAIPALAQSPTPEPSTTLLLGAGLLGIGYVAYKKTTRK